MIFFTGINTCTCMHTVIPYEMYGQVSISRRRGRSHGRGRLHGSNVLICCTTEGGHYFGWVLSRAFMVCNELRLGSRTNYDSLVAIN